MDIQEYKKRIKNAQTHPWEMARWSILHFMIHHTVQPEKLIFDIGSGDGYMAENLFRTYPYCKVVAVDVNYDQDFINQKKDLSNIAYVTTLNEGANLYPLPADLVTIMDVLEHIEYPDNLLKDIGRTLHVQNNSIFIITVPAYQSLFSRHDEILGHFKRYNRNEISKLLGNAGFIVIRSGYFFTSLALIRYFEKLAQKVFKSNTLGKNGVYNWMGGKTITLLLKNLFFLEFKISWYLSKIGIYIPGLSCYCLCRKSPS